MCYVLVKKGTVIFVTFFHLMYTIFRYNFLEPPRRGGEGLMHVTRTLKEPHLPEHTC